MKIAAFNVKNLGWTKVNNVGVRKNLIKIVSRYSVVVMLEVVDKSGKAMQKFLIELNKHGRNRHHPYTMVCSKSLGRDSYKEKFVYFYREDEVTMIDSYQYEEGDEEEDDGVDDDEEVEEEEEEEEENVDLLAREPFILQFACHNTVVQRLVLIPVHIKPEDADIELDALDGVVEAVRERWETDNIIILGDFNADGRYLSRRRIQNVKIHSPPYHWLIDDNVDTTTSDLNDHTYDRIVVYGDHMCDAVVPNSAKPFDFQRAYHLSKATTRAISDHYPVEMELRDN